MECPTAAKDRMSPSRVNHDPVSMLLDACSEESTGAGSGDAGVLVAQRLRRLSLADILRRYDGAAQSNFSGGEDIMVDLIYPCNAHCVWTLETKGMNG